MSDKHKSRQERLRLESFDGKASDLADFLARRKAAGGEGKPLPPLDQIADAPEALGQGQHIKVLWHIARRYPLSNDFDADMETRHAIIADWNAWVAAERKKNADFSSDLVGLNGQAGEWRQTALWGRPWKKTAYLPHLRLWNIDWRNADLWIAHLERSYLVWTQLKDAYLCWAYFNGAHMYGADLRDAILLEAEFRDANLMSANISNATLRGADFTDADVTNIRYRTKLGSYLGIHGIESCFGSPVFRRDALDQDFIDAKFELCRLSGTKNPIDFVARLIHGLIFLLWSLSNYGRSIWLSMVYVAAGVGGFGALYKFVLLPDSVEFAGSLACSTLTDARCSHSFLDPWYAAGMGAATLGLTDLLRPLDVWGKTAMFVNALSGLILFGLMIAVMQNKVARRA